MLPKLKIKKWILAIVVSTILLSPIFPINTHRALAIGLFVPTNDFSLNNISSISFTKAALFRAVKIGAYSAANTAILTISANLQNRILSKANLFVTNLRTNLLNLENKVGNKLGVEIDAVEGCFPNLNLAPVPNPVWTPNKFKVSLTCTPRISNEMVKFYQTGGFNWSDFKKMTEDPTKYNPFGGVLAVNVELSKREALAKQNNLTELQWGRGTLGVRNALTGLIKTPASEVQNLLSESFGSKIARLSKGDSFISTVVSSAMSAVVQAQLNSVLNSN